MSRFTNSDTSRRVRRTPAGDGWRDPTTDAMRPRAKIDRSPATQSCRGAYFRSISLSGPIRVSTDPVSITSSRTELSVGRRPPASLPVDTAASSRAVSMPPSIRAMRAVGKDGWGGAGRARRRRGASVAHAKAVMSQSGPPARKARDALAAQRLLEPSGESGRYGLAEHVRGSLDAAHLGHSRTDQPDRRSARDHHAVPSTAKARGPHAGDRSLAPYILSAAVATCRGWSLTIRGWSLRDPTAVRQLGHCLLLACSRYDSPEAMWMAEREHRSQAKLFRTEPVPGKAGSGRLFDDRHLYLRHLVSHAGPGGGRKASVPGRGAESNAD